MIGRPPNGTEKVKRYLYFSKEASDFAGPALSLIVEQAITVKMGRAYSLEDVRLKVTGNLNNLQTYILSSNKKIMRDEDHTKALEAIAKIRQLVEGLEGNAISRKE